MSRRLTSSSVRTAYIVFDVLSEGARDLRDLPLLERRQVVERLFKGNRDSCLRVSEMVRGDGRALYERALEQGWEGLIAKHADSLYKSGKRTPDWRKIKITQEQEFVVGGWTEPRQTRAWFGALLLGVYEGSRARLRRPYRDRIQRARARAGDEAAEAARNRRVPLHARPRTNERPHWVEPRLVAQVKFTEWTADAKLRHPVYLGLRDDKNPREVVREQKGAANRAAAGRSTSCRA